MAKSLSYKLPKLIGERLKDLHWNIRELAYHSGIREQRLYDNLRGDTPMSLETGIAIIQALGMDDPQNKALQLLKQIQKNHESVKSKKED